MHSNSWSFWFQILGGIVGGCLLGGLLVFGIHHVYRPAPEDVPWVNAGGAAKNEQLGESSLYVGDTLCYRNGDNCPGTTTTYGPTPEFPKP
jgi:hypothetical protein